MPVGYNWFFFSIIHDQEYQSVLISVVIFFHLNFLNSHFEQIVAPIQLQTIANSCRSRLKTLNKQTNKKH